MTQEMKHAEFKKGKIMKLLLTSVFKPFGVDDEFGRKENKIELFDNQVTREQGIFSLRFFHNSLGLYLLAENINVPTTVLDFPTIKEFIKEIKKGYDYIGISFITPNFKKAQAMAELIREHSPKTQIILGGHGTRIPDIKNLIDCDYVATGDGIYWLRQFFNEDTEKPIKHPAIKSAFSQQLMGVPLPTYSAVIMPGVGCPNGCRFCATSHFFEKKYTPYYKTGKELYDVMVNISDKLKTHDFFVMDENFLKAKDRVDELLYYMKKDNNLFNFAIFSSAETIINFGIKKLAELGVMFIWLGIESKVDVYEKNKGIDIKKLIAELKENGINILGSGILFLEHHTKENISQDIDYLLQMETTYTQFMQLGPMPQTQLYLDYKEKGLLKFDIPYEEWHGQHRIWFNHPEFTPEDTQRILKQAFIKDFEKNGPSILRRLETHMKGYINFKDAPDYILRQRANYFKSVCLECYPLLPLIKLYCKNPSHKKRVDELYGLYQKEFGKMSISEILKIIIIFGFTVKEFLRLHKIISQRQPKTYLSKNSVTESKPEIISQIGKVQELAPSLVEF